MSASGTIKVLIERIVNASVHHIINILEDVQWVREVSKLKVPSESGRSYKRLVNLTAMRRIISDTGSTESQTYSEEDCIKYIAKLRRKQIYDMVNDSMIAISANDIVNDGYTFPDPYGCSVVRVDQILQELVACTEDMEIEENENDDEDGNTTVKKYIKLQ